MENNLNSDILDKITKTCTCKSISRAKIKEAIKNGAHTIEEVSKITGACTATLEAIGADEDITNKINSMPFVKGDADNSAVLKGGNNQVISEGGVALGENNLVGLKGFYYKHIRFVSNTLANVYLSKTQVIPTITTGGEIKDTTVKPTDLMQYLVRLVTPNG